MTTTTAAQPLDLDRIEAKVRRGESLWGFELDALIAQARTARLDTTASASDEFGPAVPDDIVAAIRTYGDYRADDHPASSAWFGEVIKALRRHYRAPVAAQQAAAVELRGCTSCEWTGDTDRMCGSIGPLCPECGDTTEFLGQGSAAKAPAAQADTLALIEAARMDIIDFLRASNDTDAASRVEEFMTAGQIVKNIGIASPASTPDASQQATRTLFALKRDSFVSDTGFDIYQAEIEGWRTKQAAAVAAPSDKIEEIRALLQEAYGFASMSPRGMGNINAALDLLDEITTAPTAGAATTSEDARDAARYRWLRAQPFGTWKRIGWNTWNDDPDVFPIRDEDIDSVMRATQQEGGNG